MRHLNPLYFLVTSLRNVHAGSWKLSLLYLIIPTIEAKIRFMKSWQYKMWVTSSQNLYRLIWVSITDTFRLEGTLAGHLSNLLPNVVSTLYSDHVALSFYQFSLENLQGWKFHSISR